MPTRYDTWADVDLAGEPIIGQLRVFRIGGLVGL
jgi:hypothetical protein